MRTTWIAATAFALVAAFEAHAQITFSAATPYSVGPQPGYVRAADLNGDGRVDLVTINANGGGPGSISVLLAGGAAGSFAPATTYGVGANNAVGIAVADFNGDAKPDIATANFGSQNVTILLNDGSGGFPTATAGFAGGGAINIVAANFNGGGIDLALTRYNAHTVSILPGNGNGSFSAGQTLTGTGFMYPIVAGDFNGDGKMDLAAADSNILRIYLGVGDGTFTAGPTYTAGVGPTSIAVGDLNGDGRLDLAVASDNGAVSSSGPSGTITILLGNGDGTFTAGATVGSGGVMPQDIAAGDLDRDGKLDLVVANFASNNFAVLKGNGDGTFAAPVAFVTGTQTNGIALADFDGDGRLDIAATSFGSSEVFVRLSTTPVTPNPPIAVVATPGNAQLSVAFAPPADAASLPILDYTATCGGISATGTGSPVVVSGLTNGVAYTCTVVARNATGTSIPSAPSNSATPRAAATVALASGANPVAVGVAVTFTATVTGSSPTGTVSFKDGGVTIGTCGAVVLAAGNAQCTTTFTSVGTHAITADYSGDVANTPGTGTLSGGEVVSSSAASVTVTTSASPVDVGVNVTFTTTVAGFSPTGAVNFKSGGASIAGCSAVTLAAGSAQCTTSFASPGTKAITADYSGDGANVAGTGTLAGGEVVVQKTFTGPTATGTGNATVAFTGGGPACSFAPQGNGPLQSAFFIPVTGHPKSPPAGTAPAVDFPQGLLDFVLLNCTPGSTMSFAITYPNLLPGNPVYWKYGPTPSNASPHWYVLPATITGNIATFSITDGGIGDDDLAANGTLVDQGGPGVPGAVDTHQVPTLSEWALMLLALLTAALGARRLNPAAPRR